MAVEAARGAQKERAILAVSAAWHTANFAAGAFGGKLPKLKDVLDQLDSAAPAQIVRQTPEQIAAVMGEWRDVWRNEGKLREAKRV